MSDKPALFPELPGAWTGTAPDADALFAMAEAALATVPDVFRPHIEGVVIGIEEFADDEVLAQFVEMELVRLDALNHPTDISGEVEELDAFFRLHALAA